MSDIYEEAAAEHLSAANKAIKAGNYERADMLEETVSEFVSLANLALAG